MFAAHKTTTTGVCFMVFRYDENPLWSDLFTNTFQSLKPAINHYIKILNLAHVYCFKTAQSDIYIIIYDFYDDERLLGSKSLLLEQKN